MTSDRIFAPVPATVTISVSNGQAQVGQLSRFLASGPACRLNDEQIT